MQHVVLASETVQPIASKPSYFNQPGLNPVRGKALGFGKSIPG